MIIKLEDYLLQNPQINQLVMELTSIHGDFDVYDTALAAYCDEEAKRRLGASASDNDVREVALKIGEYLSDNDAINNIAKRCYQQHS